MILISVTRIRQQITSAGDHTLAINELEVMV
jgi:hypothetical protein